MGKHPAESETVKLMETVYLEATFSQMNLPSLEGWGYFAFSKGRNRHPVIKKSGPHCF